MCQTAFKCVQTLLVTVSTNNHMHDVTQLLPLTIIIDKGNITINREYQLIAHP